MKRALGRLCGVLLTVSPSAASHAYAFDHGSPTLVEVSGSGCTIPNGAVSVGLAPGDGGSPVIVGSIDGFGPMAFVLDNGAGGTSVTPAVAQDLSLPVARQVETAGGLGGMVNVRTHHVSEAAFGPLSLQDVELAALEGPVFESHTIAGLAGVDLFADRTVWWDLERYSVSLTPGGEAPVSDPCWQLVDSEWMRPWRVMVPVVIDGISGMAMLDTGAQKSVINNAFATAIGGERAIADEGITGIDGRSIDLMLVKVARASIGPWQWEQPPLQTAELAVFDRMGAPTNNFMLLGMDWLRGHRFVQDYRQQKVWLAVPGSSA